VKNDKNVQNFGGKPLAKFTVGKLKHNIRNEITVLKKPWENSLQ
jgi:hypothetical protein